MSAQKFDAIIVGCGQAGTPLAGRLTGAGMSVALIERKLVGGTCVNTGCIPTKTMVASAYAAHLARRAADYGVTLGGSVGVDMKAVKARKDKISNASRTGLEEWIASMKGCTLYRGHARFENAKTVRVGDKLLEADKIFLNVGGRAAVPDLPGVQDIDYLTNSLMMDLDVLPRHLVVVGGSYISLELAPGELRIRVESPGHKPDLEIIHVAAGAMKDLKVTLKKKSINAVHDPFAD